MRKVFLLLLVLGLCICSTQKAEAQYNIFTSWTTVQQQSTKTITFPYDGRDLWIQNGSDTIICVNLIGIDPRLGGAVDCSSEGSFALDANNDLYLGYYSARSVKFSSFGGTASPISVVVTY